LPVIGIILVVGVGFALVTTSGNAECSGWDDRYEDAGDVSEGKERFYIRYYDAPVACAEVIEADGQKKTQVTVFGESEECPVPIGRSVTKEEWQQMHLEVTDALKNLCLPFE